MAISEVATGFPMEIWHQIWENLDFQNRQKTCVLVSKTWKFEIRNQPKFSNEVKIKTMDHELEDITAIHIVKLASIGKTFCDLPKGNANKTQVPRSQFARLGFPW